MKQAIVVFVAVVIGLSATLYFLPERDRRIDTAAGTDEGGKQVERRVFDPTKGRARDVFSPDFRKVVIDGEPRRYQSVLMWCGRTRPGNAGEVVLQDIRLLLNPEPRNREELEALFTIRPSTPANIVGREIERRLGTQSGISAARALLRGGERFSTAESAELDGGVTVYMADRRNVARRGTLKTSRLDLVLEDGRIVRATNDEPVVFESEDGEIRGQGLDVDFRTGNARILRDVRGRLVNLEVLGQRGEPVEITGAGPLVLEATEAVEPDASSGPFDRLARSPTRLSLDGGVELVQGRSRIRGQRLEMATDAERKLQRGVLIGGVEADMPEGSFSGRTATVTRTGEKTFRVEIAGPGIRARMNELERVLPTGRSRGELWLETDGTVVIDRLAAETGKVAEAVVSPDVAIRSEETLITAPRLTVHLLRIPANEAGDVTDKTRDVPGYLELADGVAGRSPEGRFRCHTLTYERSHDESGLEVEDLLQLVGEPVVARAINFDPAGPKPETVWQQLMLSEGEIEIAAARLIEIRRDPLERRATRLLADEKVLMRRLRQGPSAQPLVLATMACRHLTLRLAPGSGDHFSASGTAAKRDLSELLEAFEAQGPVQGHVTDQAELRGQRVTHDAARGITEIVTSTGTTLSRLRLRDEQGNPREIEARSITFESALRRLIALERATAALHLPRLLFPGDPPREPGVQKELLTRLTADRVIVSFAAPETPEVPDRRPVAVGPVREVFTENNVLLKQESTVVRCVEARINMAQEHAKVKGAPVRLERDRVVKGRKEKEFVVAREITLIGRTALMKGGVQSRFLVEKSRAGSTLVLGKSDKATDEAPLFPEEIAARPLVPIQIDAADSLYLSEDQVLLRGRSRVVHGDPRGDGYEVAGDRMTMFLVPEATSRPGESRLKATKVVVEGTAQFSSRDIDGRGEVLVFDRDRRLIRLTSRSAPSTLRLHGDLQISRKDYVLDLSDPDRPRLTSVRPPSRDFRR